jgi:hypothetical protein
VLYYRYKINECEVVNMKTGRLKELCPLVWALLTDEEKEAYFHGTGTIGFIEDVAKLLSIEAGGLSEEFIDELTEQL